MSITNILKHVAQHNTWNITHSQEHLQVQVATWPHCRCRLEHERTCHCRIHLAQKYKHIKKCLHFPLFFDAWKYIFVTSGHVQYHMFPIVTWYAMLSLETM